MKKVKCDLKKMLEEIEWITVPKTRRTSGIKFTSDQVVVDFLPTKKNSELIDRVCIRIGSDVLRKLKWIKGDQIVVMQDKNNLMNFMLVKTESGSGFSLCGILRSDVCRIQFKWNHKKELKRFCGIVDYHIKNNQLIIFTVDTEKGIL